MNKLDRAREAVRRSPLAQGRSLPGGGELTADMLAASLEYSVYPQFAEVDDERAVPIASSKYKGLPHLPDGFDWPDGQYFLAQLNLADIHPFDIHDAFPATGMVYLFFNGEGKLTVTHYDGPAVDLRVTAYPDARTLPDSQYYLKDFITQSSTMRFADACLFDLGSDAYNLSEGVRLVPQQLRDEVAEILGAPVAERDRDTHIFGRALYWQGEDDGWTIEDLEELKGVEGIDLDFDEEELEEMRLRSYPRTLLFQDDFGEGHIHFWIRPEDARRRDYTAAWMDYSGT